MFRYSRLHTHTTHDTNVYIVTTYSELMEAAAQRRDEQYQRYALLLESYLQDCQAIVAQIDAVLGRFDALTTQQQDSRRKVVGLLEAYRNLEAECQALRKVVEGLATRTAAVQLQSRLPESVPRVQSTSSGQWQGPSGALSVGGLSKATSDVGRAGEAGLQPAAAQDTVTGWLSSTLGIDEATVASYLPKLW